MPATPAKSLPIHRISFKEELAERIKKKEEEDVKKQAIQRSATGLTDTTIGTELMRKPTMREEPPLPLYAKPINENSRRKVKMREVKREVFRMLLKEHRDGGPNAEADHDAQHE